MPVLSLSVSLRVKADRVDEFLAAIAVNQASALRDEAGCLHFDVSRDTGDSTLFHLYEVYRDSKAVEAHRDSPHFREWREVAAAVLEEDGRVTREGELLFGSTQPKPEAAR